VGKHSGADDSTVDPLVADALARRSGRSGAGQHEGPDRPGREGDVGWPGDPDREGEGLGWPAGSGQPRNTAVEVGTPGGEPTGGADEGLALTGPRRGWRRLFGASPAA
jgi:hypothetical protein